MSKEPVMTSTELPDIAAIRAAEAQRIAAITNRDHELLSDTLSDELDYMHSTGLREGKEDFIKTTIGGTPRVMKRGDLDVRLFGDIALVTGEYQVHVQPELGFPEGRKVRASGLSVWRREDGTWRLYAHHGTAQPSADL
jgi:ketosteroid isomerase-like protein